LLPKPHNRLYAQQISCGLPLLNVFCDC
jgi:hypothetical protein